LVVNESHPSGTSFPADPAPGFSYATSGAGQYDQTAQAAYAQQGVNGYGAYDGYATGGFDQGLAYDTYDDVSYSADPLFGSMPGQSAPDQPVSGNVAGAYNPFAGYDPYGTAATGTTGTYGTGDFDTGGYDSGAFDSGGYDAGSAAAWADSAHQTGQWDAAGWDTSQWQQPGEWDVTADGQAGFAGQNPGWDAYGYDTDGSGFAAAAAEGHVGGYEDYDAYAAHEQPQPAYDGAEFVDEGVGGMVDATTAMPAFDEYQTHDAYEGSEYAPHDDGSDVESYDDVETFDVDKEHPEHDLRVPNLPGRRRAARPRRSALLTVAVPSVAVMGVAAAAAATVATPQEDTSTQAADIPVKPANKKLDTQLAGLSADADDFADRASRAQERLDLQARQEAERKRKAAIAAKKEAMRPKFALPVSQHGLSATYGQSGLNWMSVHTGIDFPVSEGTPVMAATDGTITTKWDVSFGNMAVVTAPDGTETWYCHLSSTKIRSGTVKAGDTIGYSGTSGNSTGPHLHFEVHPGGGDAIDPLPWLQGKGLNPQ
jgi:murein DD-endopeptidase MepM/ murein hydrolase activator NlpD